MATLPDVWPCGIIARTDWPSVSIMELDETASLICMQFVSQCGLYSF